MTVAREDIAWHEAGHAVMRQLRGLPATAIRIHEHGGTTDGTGRGGVRAEDYLLVTLAGYAAEVGCMAGAVKLAESRSADFDAARRVIAETEGLHLGRGVEVALAFFFERACEHLWPYLTLLECLAERLERDGVVSARSVAAYFREYERALARERAARS